MKIVDEIYKKLNPRKHSTFSFCHPQEYRNRALKIGDAVIAKGQRHSDRAISKTSLQGAFKKRLSFSSELLENERAEKSSGCKRIGYLANKFQDIYTENHPG